MNYFGRKFTLLTTKMFVPMQWLAVIPKSPFCFQYFITFFTNIYILHDHDLSMSLKYMSEIWSVEIGQLLNWLDAMVKYGLLLETLLDGFFPLSVHNIQPEVKGVVFSFSLIYFQISQVVCARWWGRRGGLPFARVEAVWLQREGAQTPGA